MLALRLQAIGRSPADLHAVFVTHEHSDHVKGVGALARKHKIPIFSTEGTFRGMGKAAGRLPDWYGIPSEGETAVGDLRVESYPTVHDAEQPVAFVVRAGNVKVGHATDLGIVTPMVREKLRDADALLIESNHDIDMLEAGPYPWPLKQRIKGERGHLSNEACADLLGSVIHDRLRLVVLMHLSQTNNLPDIAHITAGAVLKGHSARMVLAPQHESTPLMSLQ